MNQMTTWPPSIPGCPPSSCFDPNALLQCYSDLQAQTALTKQILLNLLATDPTVTAAIIAAIEKSGSNLPTIGVTNGTDAQPGQVGEWVLFTQNFAFPTTPLTQNITMGILQPGDWDYGYYVNTTTWTTSLQTQIAPLPAGFSNILYQIFASPTAIDAVVVQTTVARALISVPTLVALQFTTNNQGAGDAASGALAIFWARRAR